MDEYRKILSWLENPTTFNIDPSSNPFSYKEWAAKGQWHCMAQSPTQTFKTSHDDIESARKELVLNIFAAGMTSETPFIEV